MISSGRPFNLRMGTLKLPSLLLRAWRLFLKCTRPNCYLHVFLVPVDLKNRTCVRRPPLGVAMGPSQVSERQARAALPERAFRAGPVPTEASDGPGRTGSPLAGRPSGLATRVKTRPCLLVSLQGASPSRKT